MADKDPAPNYDLGLPQKPANLDSKVPIKMARKSNTDDEGAGQQERPANAGYYLNVAQKGKLILPTALWILLIIAGVCFLTLLASLNKTMGTLDTLVELEQAKEARALVSEHLHHRRLHKELEREHELGGVDNDGDGEARNRKRHAHKHKAKTEAPPAREQAKPSGTLFKDTNDELMPGDDSSIMSASWIMPIESSWFSMPSWTSLEPPRRELPARNQNERRPSHSMHGDALRAPPAPRRPMALFDNLLSGPSQPDTIVTIRQEGPIGAEPQRPAGLLGSIMKQMAPMLDMVGAGASGELVPVDRAGADQSDSEEAAPLISAKIDNLNVHINPAQEKELKSPEEINSLEKSIDDLVGKLMDQRVPPLAKHKGHERHGKKRPHTTPEEVLPIINNNEHQHKRPIMPPFSPLADLLLPPSLRQHDSGPMFIQALGFDEPSLAPPDGPRPHGPPNGNDLPEAQLIIAVSDEPEPIRGPGHNKPSRETNRHQVSNTRRPPIRPSPYEVDTPFLLADDPPMIEPLGLGNPFVPRPPFGHQSNHPDHHATRPGGPKAPDTPWNKFADELAQVLVLGHKMEHPHGSFQPNNKGNGIKLAEQPPILLFDGGMSLAPGEQLGPVPPPTILDAEHLMSPMGLLHPDEQHKPAAPAGLVEAPKNDKVGDIFGSIFGPPPASHLVVAEPNRPSSSLSGSGAPDAQATIGTNKPLETGPAPPMPHQNETSKSLPPVDLTVSAFGEPKKTAEVKQPGSGPTPSAMGPAEAVEERQGLKNAHDMFSNFMGTMFALPQMSGESGQQRVGASNDSKPSSSSGGASGKLAGEIRISFQDPPQG